MGGEREGWPSSGKREQEKGEEWIHEHASLGSAWVKEVVLTLLALGECLALACVFC